jgi:hypothetical protein
VFLKLPYGSYASQIVQQAEGGAVAHHLKEVFWQEYRRWPVYLRQLFGNLTPLTAPPHIHLALQTRRLLTLQ